MASYTDFDQIYPNLFQGSYPRLTESLMKQFDVVVYCAVEKQPSKSALKNVPRNKKAIGIPLEDDPYQPITLELEHELKRRAFELAGMLRAGKKVLVTCAMGLNRSGIVSALTLMAVTGCHGRKAFETVQQRRRPADDGTRALFNPMFARFIQTHQPIA